MRQYCEFRIADEHAHLLFAEHEGTRLGDELIGYTRKVLVPTDDPRFFEMKQLDEEFRRKGKGSFFTGCFLEYHYTRNELASAELLALEITAMFGPPGETCGTEFDESGTCDICGAGRKQVSELVLDLRKAPKTRDIAFTISRDEWIVSQKLAELLVDAKLTGFDLHPVKHKARYQDDPIRLSDVATGRELLRQGKALGLSEPEWEFYVWLNRPEQKVMCEKARAEHADLRVSKARKKSKPLPIWYQLVTTSSPVPIVPPTRTGSDPFDEDPEDRYRCPFGHVIGWTLLSEVSVPRSEWDGSDLIRTSNMTGFRSGLVMPIPCLLISPQFYHVLKKNKIKGYKVAIAHFV